jgi:3-oxoacyl-[acyl-carrier-protein] synthase II
MRRVVVTGLSMITPVGNNAACTFEGLCKGLSGITELKGEKFQEFEDFPIKYAGILQNDFKSYKDLARVSARQAFEDAGLGLKKDIKVGLLFGTDKSSFNYIRSFHSNHKTTPINPKVPDFPFQVSTSSAISEISKDLNLSGFTSSISAGFATGQAAVIEAAKLIRCCGLDVALAGAAEFEVDPGVMMSFYKAGFLSRKENFDAGRPFDLARDGFVYGNGAGCLVLEELQHAIRRKAKIYCEVVGFGFRSEGKNEDMQDAVFATMDLALKKAGIGKDEVEVFNCDASGYKLFDDHEAKFIEDLDGGVTSHKGNIGHLLSASGSVQSAVSCLILDKQIIPPIQNLTVPSVESVMYVSSKAEEGDYRYVMSNSFSYDGGLLTSIVFKKYFPDV